MSKDSKNKIETIVFNHTNFQTWANGERFGLSAKVGGNNGAVLQLVKSPDNEGIRRTVGVTLSKNESGPLKINAQVLLDAVSYAAQATIKICKETDTNPSQVTIPVNYSFASVFASDKQALKDGQKYIKETQDSAYIYAPNFWIGDNKITNSDASESIDCKKGFDLKNYLLTKLRVINPDYKVSGKNGQWTFSAPKAPTIITNITNDGNMVAMSAATSAGLKANKIYLHTVQGGGGNLNIVKTNNNREIEEVINTEAFGQPLTSVFTHEEIAEIKLIHGDRCDQNIERWTAGSCSEIKQNKGIKASVVYLIQEIESYTNLLNKVDPSGNEMEDCYLWDEKLKKIAQTLDLDFNDLINSKLLSSEFLSTQKPNKSIRELAKAGDKLALALLKHQNWITAETIKRNPKLQKIKSENSNPQIAQLSYHGSAIKKRLRIDSLKEHFNKLLKKLTDKIFEHSPELDGSVDLTEAQLAPKA